MSHTKEPWAKNGARIESKNGHGWENDGWIIAGLEGPDAEANARRIVACVNACAGIRTEALEHRAHMLKAEDDTVATITKQRDQLLTALINCRRTLEVVNEVPGGPINDTIWYGPAETLFDYMDSVIESASKIDFV